MNILCNACRSHAKDQTVLTIGIMCPRRCDVCHRMCEKQGVDFDVVREDQWFQVRFELEPDEPNGPTLVPFGDRPGDIESTEP